MNGFYSKMVSCHACGLTRDADQLEVVEGVRRCKDKAYCERFKPFVLESQRDVRTGSLLEFFRQRPRRK